MSLNEATIAKALSRLIDKDPIIKIEKASEVSIKFVSLAGKSTTLTLPEYDDVSDELNALVASDESFKLAISILSDRLERILPRVEELEGVDTESLVKSLVDAYQFDEVIREEVSEQVRALGDGLSDVISQTVIDGIVNSVVADLKGVSEKLGIHEKRLNASVDKKTLTTAINKEIKRLEDIIGNIDTVSEDRVVELIGEIEIPTPPNAVTSFELRDGRMYAIFADGSSKNLGMFYDDYVMGIQGDRGYRGYSAYEIAVQNGFIGTEQEWLASLSTKTYYNDVVVSGVMQFIYTAFTMDSTGYFEINSDIYNHGADTVLFKEGEGFIISNTEEVSNRTVFVTIESVSPTGLISGYAFIHRESTSLIGNINKSIIPVPVGTPVKVKLLMG